MTKKEMTETLKVEANRLWEAHVKNREVYGDDHRFTELSKARWAAVDDLLEKLEINY